MKTERRIVDNRVFLLGLDELYRESVKAHERDELRACARETARTLSVTPTEVPVEGYYSEDQQLAEYFRLVRALQQVPIHRESELESVGGYLRLKQVIESPIFGPRFDGDCLLTAGEDSLSFALNNTTPEWDIENLTSTAYQCALDSDDFSLVALAALARDSVVLAALRETVVLYAKAAVFGCEVIPDPEYVWQVDDVVESRARRFVEEFNRLFNESLPQPNAENAEIFWHACDASMLIGRCVRIGFDDSVQPIRQYHWAIDPHPKHTLITRDFWDTDIWTTQRYREDLSARNRRLHADPETR